MKFLFIICIFCFIACTNSTPSLLLNNEKQIDYFDAKYQENQRVNVVVAQNYIDSLLQFSIEKNSIKGVAIATLNRGILENIKGNFNLAIQQNEKALALFKELKEDTLTAKALQALGVNFWQKGENDKALQLFLESFDINEKLQLVNEMASNYNSISMIYQSKHNIQLAEEYANRAMDLIKGNTPAKSHISILHNMANIYGMQEKYQAALRLDSIGLAYCNQLNIQFNKSMFYDNIANCYFFMKQYDTSIYYHTKAISIDSSFGNKKQLGDTYNNLGYIYAVLNDVDKAEFYYLQSIQLCKETGYKIGIQNALSHLSNLYYTHQKPNEAYELLSESISVKDSIISDASEQKIAELQTLFETEKKKKKIAEQDLKISRRNILLIILFSILVLSLITYYLFYNRYKSKQEQKLQQEQLKSELKRTQAILESEEKERQRLARELHDGVGHLLSAAKLNLSAIQTAELKSAGQIVNSMKIIDDSITEIRSISHNMVPDALQKNGLVFAVDNFIEKLNQLKEQEISFEYYGYVENMLDDAAKLMLYRIIQEAVNNAIKYAEASTIAVQLSADEHEISLIIEDNGKGFDIENIKSKNGIGLRNMQLRTDYLHGKLNIESSEKNGTTLIVEIPLS